MCSLLIGGKLLPSSSGRVSEVRSPATGAVVGTVPEGTVQDVDAAVRAAHAAFASWGKLLAHDREAIMRKATAHTRTKAKEIGLLMALEQGKPLSQSIGEVTAACDLIDFYAAEAPRIDGYAAPTEKASYRSLVTYYPVGVVAAITPWNYPVSLLSWKMGPALAAGCTMVVKPTSVTPMSPTAFCQAMIEGGIPAGVLNVITGGGKEVGSPLVAHPLVNKLAMTGSTETGRTLNQLASKDFKRVTLELGGHCPAVVLADADLKKTAKAIAYKAFRNMGQSCSSINRIYVPASIHDELVALTIAEAKALSIGDGIEPANVDLGPMATAGGVATVKSQIADAVAKGAKVVYGGTAPAGRESVGNFFLPTVLTGMTHDMVMMREETFGPVAPFMAYADLEQAITWANDTRYGLAAYVFTRDLSQAFLVSERLEAGSVCVNHVAVNTGYAPYQGWKDSGVGVELSREAIYEYLKRKHVKYDV